ncbi:MAG: nucleotidyltransferase domain-containing protein [Promethearchaeota archaeon]|jgi:predicted nucleotidyltransferase
MKSRKILKDHHDLITYSDNNWSLLKKKREIAKLLLEIFNKEGLHPYVHGSIARGDVHEDSDIDIIFIQQIPSFQIEYILNKNGFTNYFREIIMATPLDTIKLYIHLSELESITIPLSKFDTKYTEFYNFGGKLNLLELLSEERTTGIDKRLVLIKPNPQGHEEISIIGNEAYSAKEVGVSIDTVNGRKKVLLRREQHGRTGVFLKREIQLHESTEAVLKNLAKTKSIVRKKLLK